jgi:TRAP-type C4-dicarboxylate transport system permease small subunit
MFWRLYDGVTTVLLAALGAAMFGIAIGNAFLRYFLDLPLVWGEEISRYCMVWATLVGVALAYRAGLHVAVTIMADVLPRGVVRGLRIACHVLVLGVAYLLWRSGTVLSDMLGAIEAPSSGVAMHYIYAAMPFGAVLLLIEALRHLHADILGRPRVGAA